MHPQCRRRRQSGRTSADDNDIVHSQEATPGCWFGISLMPLNRVRTAPEMRYGRRPTCGINPKPPSSSSGRDLSDGLHLADPPDLLRRPLPCPIWVNKSVATQLSQIIRCLDLDQVEHVEAASSQQPDPIAVPKVEFDARLAGPVEPMHPEVRAQQPIGCRPIVVRL